MLSCVLMGQSVKLKEKHNPLSSPLQLHVLFEMKRCWMRCPWYNSQTVPKEVSELLYCGGLTLTGHQAPTKSFCHSSPQRDRRENKIETSPVG